MEKKVSKYPNPDDADDEVSLPKYLTLQTGHQILKEWNLQKIKVLLIYHDRRETVEETNINKEKCNSLQNLN